MTKAFLQPICLQILKKQCQLQIILNRSFKSNSGSSLTGHPSSGISSHRKTTLETNKKKFHSGSKTKLEQNFCLCKPKTQRQKLVRGYHSDGNETNNSSPPVKGFVERMAAARTAQSGAVEQNFDFFLVLDFEATCDDDNPPKPQEVIEFPVLKVNAVTHNVDSIFHQYVQPLHHPNLTPFCTQLTGIVQDMVDNQPTFPEVMQSFHQWMNTEGLTDPQTRSIFVTCGDWDLKSMLPRQCSTSQIASRPYFNHWINIKKSYADHLSVYPKGMMAMLNGIGLQHVGRHHSGIDDCRNIANVVVELLKQGYVFKQNGWLR